MGFGFSESELSLSEPSGGAFCEQPAEAPCHIARFVLIAAPPRRRGAAAGTRRRLPPTASSGCPRGFEFPGAESVLAFSPGCELK